MDTKMELKIIDYLRKFFIISSCLTPLLFFFPWEWKLVWAISWYLLFLVMIIRPLSDLFSNISILKKLVSLRKEIWIFVALTTIMHWVLLFKIMNAPLIESFFDFTWLTILNHMFFAKLWAIISFILLITSNIWSIKILKQKWKWIQRFAYLYFFAWWLHVFLIWKDHSIIALLLMITLIIIWLFAKYKKIQI